MRSEPWRQAMVGVFSRNYNLPDAIRDIRDEAPTPERRAELAWSTVRTAGAVHSLLWSLSAVEPVSGLYDPPMLHVSEAEDIANEVGNHPPRDPFAQLEALLHALRFTANSLYGTCLLLTRHPHGAGLDVARFAEAGRFFATPTALVASTLAHLCALAPHTRPEGFVDLYRATCHLAELLARSALHLFCVGGLGQPAATGLPSPLLPEPGAPHGPWPGWPEWVGGWMARFPPEVPPTASR